MRIPPLTRGLSLLCVLLVACATPSSGVREDDEAPEAVFSWEEARADPSCVVPLCDEEGCALWRCRDLVEVDAAPSPSPSVVLARGPMPQAMRPPLVGNPNRWWGHPLAVPTYADPVFEIPWHNWKLRDQLARQKHPLGCMLLPEPIEKHHSCLIVRIEPWSLECDISDSRKTEPQVTQAILMAHINGCFREFAAALHARLRGVTFPERTRRWT